MAVDGLSFGPGGPAVGFIGLGAMGAPIVRYLVSRGCQMVVYDVNVDAVRAAVDAGASAASSPQEVASQTELIFVCLPSLAVLKTVFFGENGVVCHGKKCTVVDLSTTGPAFAREMRTDLGALGVVYIDAPITGNVTTAGNGKLGVMCSGPEPGFLLAERVLNVMATTTVLYLGDGSGRAQTLKLLNNVISATGMAITSEAFVLGVKGGLKPGTLLQVLNAGEASTNASRNKFKGSVLPRRFNYGARMAITAKDISLAVAEADHLGVPAWVARSAQQLWRYAVSQGGAERDGSALITYLEPWAGVEVADYDDPVDIRVRRAKVNCAVPCQVLCDADSLEMVLARLTALGWDVSVATPDDSIVADACVVRPISGEHDLSRFADMLTRQGGNVLLHNADGSHGIESVVVNMCWMLPALAHELAAHARKYGLGFVDAPLPGRLRDIQEGTATLIVSGMDQDIVQIEGLLSALGTAAYKVSDAPGQAQRTRHLDEAVAAVLLAVACESYVIGVRAGLAPEVMPKILGIETGRTLASGTLFPQHVLTRRFDHGRTIAQALHALQLVSQDATLLDVSSWVFESTRLLFGLAKTQLGAEADVTRLVELYERWAGVEVRTRAVD